MRAPAGLRLTLRSDPEQRLDLSPLVPHRLAGMDAGAIERLALNTTRRPVVVGDLFRLRPGDPARLAITGGSERFDEVGAGMQGGELVLDGDAGFGAGRGMVAGTLRIAGSAGDHAACDLRGGTIEIAGDAGAFLGGARPGERGGMRGGTVLVLGDAGARAGDHLRRGLIVIEGHAGDHPGSRMVAGTLVVCGTAGALPGYLLRRGTLVLGRAPSLSPTFVDSGATDPVFARLLARLLRPVSQRAARLAATATRRLAGDMAVLGKGELLLPDRA
ncbi:MAG TPA: formylmethanofuran dehydrogenase subunit C [Acetobacteraceae bacterium]|nr:formylmethanofuran dehydrogenase subunit C [Acetobacteraceae bacterium]